MVDIMRKGQPSPRVPMPVVRALRKLGHDIRDAEDGGGAFLWPYWQSAHRWSRTTLNKVEKGDSTVSAGSYAVVLFTLGTDRAIFTDAADPRGTMLSGASLRKNICRSAFAYRAGRKLSPDNARAQ